MRRLNVGVLALGLFVGAAAPAHAQDHDGHSFHLNDLAVTAGGMTPLSDADVTSWALGLDYERRFSASWGASAGAEYIIGDHSRTGLFGAGVTYRPVEPLRLSTGPGFEVVEKDKAGGGTKSKLYFLWGFGAYYGWHFGRWTVGPQVYLDFVGETKTNLTYQVSVGLGF